jgi:thiamine pyrophosphate-dependent acetolactate synthase large subunit-like protein
LNTNAIGRDHPFDIAMVGHAKSSLRALIDCIEGMVTTDRLAKIRASRPTSSGGLPKFNSSRAGMAPMHPDELGWALQQELDTDAIIVSENLSGSNNFFSTGFRDDEKTWIGNSGAGLGWGIGASTGAKLAEPNRQVVCNIGDGALMYSAAGFWTQARYEVPVLTVVCNNHNYQTVRNAYYRYDGHMKESNQYAGMYLGDPKIDFAGLAKSQGVDGEQVTGSADLRSALRRGIAATREGRPYLVDVIVRRTGGGANSTWYQAHSVAKARTRKV